MEKVLDSHGRWRNRIVSFRVSEEEAKIINDKVALSGLTKQEYIIRRHNACNSTRNNLAYPCKVE